MANTVVITGASSGIGRATAYEFARRGASLVLASRRPDALEDVVAECERRGGEAIAVVTDVSERKQVTALARQATKRFGGVDVWVNNASVSAYGALLDIPLKDFRRVLDVDVMGYVYGCREALRLFHETGTGTIVNVASLVGEIPQPYAAPYAMAKAAVRALGSSLRQELSLAKAKKISVSTVLPPTIDTPFFRHAANYSGRELIAMPPVYPPELVAKAIVTASGKPRAEIVVGAVGKAFVREHRRHPRSVEAQMALQTDFNQFSRRREAGRSRGNLYEALSSSDATVTGGWDGARRHRSRKAVVGALVVGGGLIAAFRLARARSAH
jgi:short-subunit dehydrogenase